MTKVRILPEILSNKIAAGEVVERPSSVVKELLENALDAGSTRIVVEIEKGGRSLIRVSDNGEGMSADDALLSIERYATSKIFNNDDLFSIKTLGFRGEALPSMASVSRLSLVSRHVDSETGTEIQIAGGKIQNVRDVGAPVGTQVTVKQLFFNTPARRKFLKSMATEMGHITDVVTNMALGRPDVHIKLIHNQKLLKHWVAVSNPADRIIQVFGQDLKNDMVTVAHDDSSAKIQGWISTPAVTRKTSRSIRVFINGRITRDRVVQHALFEGYAGRLVKGQFPLAVLFLQVPFDQVDVNVHPAKNEVRFSHQKQVHDTVRFAIAKALQKADVSKWDQRFPQEKMNFIKEKTSTWRSPSRTSGSEPYPDSRELPSRSADPFPFERPVAVPIHRGHSENIPIQSKLWTPKRFQDLEVIGQYQDIYILCQSEEDLIVLDQHAAHERIYYEKLQQSQTQTPESQGLLMPETLELNYREARALEAFLPELSKLGLEIEPFGGDTFVIKSVPVLLGQGEIKSLVIEIVEKWIEDGTEHVAENAMDDSIKLMACHGAIRANQRLTALEIKTMLKQLDACQNPSNCPHGRPTWIKLEKRYFEKLFKRVV